MKKALITGITGQDGYFLTKLLLTKGYEVHGLVRWRSQPFLGALEHLSKEDLEKITLHWGDITDKSFVKKTIQEENFTEIYHLAAQSHVKLSFEIRDYTFNVNANGTQNIVDAIQTYSPKSKLYFAATSELFGKVSVTPQNETTPFNPQSPYAIAKLAGFHTVTNYRDSYNLFFCSGILFNHESEVRGPDFVTKKITRAVANINLGKQSNLELGNLNAKRDWGYAKDFVEGMWLMLQQEVPSDYVLATGEMHSVRDFVDAAFNHVGITLEWQGSGIDEVGLEKKTQRELVTVNPSFFRDAEVDKLCGDFSKAKKVLGWAPKTKFRDLVALMVKHDLEQLK